MVTSGWKGQTTLACGRWLKFTTKERAAPLWRYLWSKLIIKQRNWSTWQEETSQSVYFIYVFISFYDTLDKQVTQLPRALLRLHLFCVMFLISITDRIGDQYCFLLIKDFQQHYFKGSADTQRQWACICCNKSNSSYTWMLNVFKVDFVTSLRSDHHWMLWFSSSVDSLSLVRTCAALKTSHSASQPFILCQKLSHKLEIVKPILI